MLNTRMVKQHHHSRDYTELRNANSIEQRNMLVCTACDLLKQCKKAAKLSETEKQLHTCRSFKNDAKGQY